MAVEIIVLARKHTRDVGITSRAEEVVAATAPPRDSASFVAGGFALARRVLEPAVVVDYTCEWPHEG